MTLDSATQTFNTGAPQYAASEITVSIEEIRQSGDGMEVDIRFVNQELNGGGFFPNYTVTATAVGQTKQKEAGEIFPNSPQEITIQFDEMGPIDIEANPGRGVESLFLSAQSPEFADIQEPNVELNTDVQEATVTYTIQNAGDKSGSTTVGITLSGPNIQNVAETRAIQVPPGQTVSDSITFEIDNQREVQVEACVEANNG
jgi:hypothetical protein